MLSGGSSSLVEDMLLGSWLGNFRILELYFFHLFIYFVTATVLYYYM